ncbi:hypothetical protein OH76DRAFT_1372984 [Lentinus brumalis]|uniref:Protein SQS1 n=1 Tax=Lentinus brumalis TaxID=2498619 RepID=A0A371DRQ2_9APHY|nr:hypothetical protein OH76DRAFT_1372984 [Polyporus brumalis]
MARGKNNRGRGGSRGSFDNGESFRGRGRGGWRGGRGNGGGRGRGRGGPAYLDELDFPIQQWPTNNPPTPPPTRGTPRGRGRGRDSHSMPFNVFKNSRGGLGSPRGSGRGRGDSGDSSPFPSGRGRNLSSKLKAGASLSSLLYEDRPLLRPVVFVRSVYTATLFEEEEDIFKSVVEPAIDGDEESHVPTADAVFRVFHPLDEAPEPSGDEGDEEQLEEIDFADIGKIQAQVDAAAKEKPTVTERTTVQQESTSFFVDTTPSNVTHNHTSRIKVERVDGGALGEATEDDDEVIVYVAPHPRNSKPSPPPTRQPPLSRETLPSTSILTGVEIGSDVQQPTLTIEMGTLYPETPRTPHRAPSISLTPTFQVPEAEELPPPPSFETVSFSFAKTTAKQQSRRLHPVGGGTPRSLLKRNRKARRKSLRGFGAFGAMHEEALLHEEDPRRAEQRRGDSDVNFGTSDEEDDVDALSADMGGMELDDGVDLAAMKRFVHGMSVQGSRQVTMDDIADIERMKVEDEEEDTRGPESAEEDEDDQDVKAAHVASSSKVDAEADESDDDSDVETDDEVEEIVRTEERVLIGEAEDEEDDEEDDDDDDDSDSPDEDETPRRGFQARLERLRASSSKDKGKGKARAEDFSDDDAMSIEMTWADEDEDYFDHIEELLAENQHLLSGGGRRARKYMFKAVQNGDFDLDDDVFASMLQPAKRGKNKHVPPELREQWEKDREKKAENKKKRALDRLILAADPLALHKGGKKGRKAMLAAARSADDLPNRIVDLVDLEIQIRRFLEDIGGPNTMSLPPADKDTRKRVHELATAFNLKSQSKGKGEARYTTLVKKSNSGVGINEGKIRHIMRQATKGKWEAPGGYGKGRGKVTSLAKHREGEAVGKDAAKIDDKNVGFRMLAAMGWSDGDRIGQSGGLDVPLTAIMKKTKLGLGATL